MLCSGLAAPVLAEVLYDRGGGAAPLLVFGPIMILTAIFAGESWGRTLSVYGVSAVRKADVFDGLIDGLGRCSQIDWPTVYTITGLRSKG